MVKISKFLILREIWFNSIDKGFVEDICKTDYFAFLTYLLHYEFDQNKRFNIAKNYINKVDNGFCHNQNDATKAEIIITACLKDVEMDYIKFRVRKFMFKKDENSMKTKNDVAKIIKDIYDEKSFNVENKKAREESKSEFVDGRKLAERRDPDLNGGKGGIEIHTR